MKMVVRMDALFLIDRNARQEGLTEARNVWPSDVSMRSRGSSEIRQECLAISRQVLPQSASSRAAAYTLNMWQKLVRCLEYEEVELSNNLAENSMRPVALGRKNWLHVGSVKAGPKVLPRFSSIR